MWTDADRDEDEIDGEYDPPYDQYQQYDQEDDYDDGIVAGPDAYWRRRFLILAAGVGALVLAVWLFPGGSPAPPKQAAATRASMAALAKGNPLPSAAYGNVYPTAAASPTASRAPKPAHSAKAKKAGTAYHPRPSATEGKCPTGDIVLSLFTGQPSYGPRAEPKFHVYAVSTAPGSCRLSYGPGAVRVVVTRHGQVVWDSAACKLTGATPTDFRLGVPQELALTWNRKAARPVGCAGSLPAGTSGTLDAVAMTAGQSSPVRTFRVTS